MVAHRYTLEKIVEELRLSIGAVAIECFTQEKNLLHLILLDGKRTETLAISTDPKRGALYFQNRLARARKNTFDTLPELLGRRLRSVEIDPNDRIVRMDFGEITLVSVVFGASNSDIILVDGSDCIVDSFKSRFGEPGDKFEIPRRNPIKIDNFDKEKTLFDALKVAEPFLGKHYAKKFIRTKLSGFKSESLDSQVDREKLQLADLTYEEIDFIERKAYEFKDEILSSRKFYLIRNKSGAEILSLIPLKEFPEIIDTFDSPSKAVSTKIRRGLIENRFSEIYDRIFGKLSRIERKTENSLKQMSDFDKTLERAEEYRRRAEILAASGNPKARVGKSIELTNRDGETETIPLDPKKNVIENAEKYFDKARNADKDVAHRKKRIPEAKSKLADIRKLIKELNSIKDVKSLEKFEKKYRIVGGKTIEDSAETTKFRTFDLGEGYTLYVGKNAANNDELTMGFAKPNDLWFHARGAGGSHAVLRLEKKDDKPPKRIIEKAAAISAYYSQARNAKYAPVAYTQKKYVRKPKGANPGSVTLAREKTVMVEPGLPVGSS